MNQQNKGMSPIAAGMTGLVLGAVGTAVGIAMSKKENREKVATKAKDIKEWGNHKVQEMKTTANKTSEKVSNKAEEAAKQTRTGIKGGRARISKKLES